MTPWHQYSRERALEELRTDAAQGLTQAEAAQRLAIHGPNQLAGDGSKSPWAILWAQFQSLMVLILIGAAVVSLLLRDVHDAIAITAIVALNTLLGFRQEYKAEKAMAALKKLSLPVVRVRREGTVREVQSVDLAPGDIVLLEAGNFVPADCRVLESAALETQEAALTGESQSIHKISDAIESAELPLGDRRNMTYAGTMVVAGRATAAVVATGMNTELGRVAELIQGVQQTATPLQRRLDHLGKRLALVALLLVAVIFVLGLLRGESLQLMLLTAVSIGVAAVPEGLPAIVTIALTLGAQRMLRRNTLIRRLPAVETLGSVTVICSDKTGTLTENRMRITTLQLAEKRVDLPSPSSPTAFKVAERPEADVRLLLTAGVLCNDALMQDPSNPDATIGDPTETALLVAASRFGIVKQTLEQSIPRVAEVPFSAERKRMTTVHNVPDEDMNDAIPANAVALLGPERNRWIAFTKGSVESLLSFSTSVWVNGAMRPLSDEWRERIAAANNELASNGMRVLGIGFRPVSKAPDPNDVRFVERALIFLGIVGMIDPPRAEAGAAVATCKSAGIRPVMITGDHALTAQSIGQQLGFEGSEQILTGAELEKLSVEGLEGKTSTASIYARVSPEHKLKIVDALQRQGNIVAMTGDGVNDAPALKKASIGIAMGRTGTDVAKEAADMILLDDNFATIVAAVEEGRVIYDNIRKFIKYILATNSGEIWTMLLAPFVGMPLPLLPLQILWMNLVTDGPPALTLGLEPAEYDTMRRPPYPPQESVFARGLGRHVIWVGLLMAVLSLGIGFTYWRDGRAEWQTMIFTTLILSQLAHIMAIRTEHRSVFRVGLFSNLPLYGTVALMVILQLLLIEIPFFQQFFQTVALSPHDLLLSAVLSSVVFWAVELEKWVTNRESAARS
jgi:Ca2+-transporting ATPase